MRELIVWISLFLTAGALIWMGYWYVSKLEEARKDVAEAFVAMLNERDFRAKAEVETMLLRAEYQTLQASMAKMVERLEAVTGSTSLAEVRKKPARKRSPTSKLRVVTNGAAASEADPEDPPAA